MLFYAALISTLVIVSAYDTTFYWDCCKPACSWGGKANTKGQVKSCNKDGTGTAPTSENSGCQNGNAYACTDISMWAVNSSFSYGFVAFSPSGNDPGCCACYELVVSGKTIQVQAINTDSKRDAFVFAVPGGGVGDYSACEKQWNAPKDGWGQRYGGIMGQASSSACSQLPSQLQSACHWRWDFLGANNPQASSYKRIACPSALTSRSGCSRTDM